MRIILHTMYFLPEFGSAPILMNEFATYLASRGHTVEVVTTIPKGKNDKYKWKMYIKEFKDGFYVKRFRTNTTSCPIGRFIAWNIYVMWTIFNLVTVRKGDIVFLRLPPLQLGITGILAKRLKGAKILLNVQDIHPDLAIESGVLKNPLAIKVLKQFEKWVYKKSEDIIVISEGFKQNLINKGVRREKIRIIPNWVDTDVICPLPKDNRVARRFSLENRFVLLYSGTITLSSFVSLERILEAAQHLQSDQDIVIAIVGEGIKKETLLKKAKKLKLSNVVFIPFQPYDDLPYLLAASDVLLVPLDKQKSHLSVPSKLYNYMAAGRPILGLAHSTSEVVRIITEPNCGVCAPPDDVAKIARAITALKNSKDYRESLAFNGRKYAVEHYAKDKVLKTYEETMKN